MTAFTPTRVCTACVTRLPLAAFTRNRALGHGNRAMRRIRARKGVGT